LRAGAVGVFRVSGFAVVVTVFVLVGSQHAKVAVMVPDELTWESGSQISAAV